MQKTAESLHVSANRARMRRKPLHQTLTELSREKAVQPKPAPAKKAPAAPAKGASMDYQQGFTSGGAM